MGWSSIMKVSGFRSIIIIIFPLTTKQSNIQFISVTSEEFKFLKLVRFSWKLQNGYIMQMSMKIQIKLIVS